MVDEREEAFRARIERGDVVEVGDWMPEDYRRGVLKFLEMHANSEIMGALPEREYPVRPAGRAEHATLRPARGRSSVST